MTVPHDLGHCRDLGAPFPHPWLQGDLDLRRDAFDRRYGARRRWVTPPRWASFAAAVAHNVSLAAGEKLDLAELYRDKWGSADLDAALRYAWRQGPLDPAMTALLRRATQTGVAA